MVKKFNEYGKNILILGASRKEKHISNLFIKKAKKASFNCFPLNPNIKEGDKIVGIKAYQNFSQLPEKIDIVTIYLNKDNQNNIENLALKLEDLGVKLVIFNPGSENENLKKQLESKKIDVFEGCSVIKINLETS